MMVKWKINFDRKPLSERVHKVRLSYECCIFSSQFMLYLQYLWDIKKFGETQDTLAITFSFLRLNIMGTKH